MMGGRPHAVARACVCLLLALALAPNLLAPGPPTRLLARAARARRRREDDQGSVVRGGWDGISDAMGSGRGEADSADDDQREEDGDGTQGGAAGEGSAARREQQQQKGKGAAGAGAGAGGALGDAGGMNFFHHTAHHAAHSGAGAAAGGGTDRCVVVFGTGRSGSSSLVDALNQLPHFFVRMEQEGAYWYLYLTWRLLGMAYSHSKDFSTAVRRVEATAGPAAAAHLSYRSAKGIYEQFAVRKKIPWFNDLHPVRMREAVRAFYAITYGYHGPGIVSGFKEVRFVRGRAFSSESSTYKDFADFVGFLRLLCGDMKVLMNSRASASLEDNWKLEGMLSRNGVIKASNDTWLNDLTLTHEWYDRYVAEHPDHAFRVIMEDMFDPERNHTLVRDMLTFLGESPDTYPHVAFNRMPTWSEGKDEKRSSSSRSGSGSGSKSSKPKPREPWQLRRAERRRAERRRRLLELTRWAAAMAYEEEYGEEEEEVEERGGEEYGEGLGFAEEGAAGAYAL